MELRTKYIIIVCKHLHHEQHSVGVCIGLEDTFHLEGSVFPLQETLAAFPNQVSVNQLCLRRWKFAHSKKDLSPMQFIMC